VPWTFLVRLGMAAIGAIAAARVLAGRSIR
jgi:hypothetical protein